MNINGLDKIEGNELIQCPYEKSHYIMRKRFQVHLDRCRKTHISCGKVSCPFNGTHLLNKVELDWHVSVCPERFSFESFKHKECHQQQTPIIVPQQDIIEGDENWADDPDVPTYNPAAYASNAAVLRLKQNATPSEKKEFRQQERLRLMNFKTN